MNVLEGRNAIIVEDLNRSQWIGRDNRVLDAAVFVYQRPCSCICLGRQRYICDEVLKSLQIIPTFTFDAAIVTCSFQKPFPLVFSYSFSRCFPLSLL